jgi:uncharacterized caspase-like protein
VTNRRDIVPSGSTANASARTGRNVIAVIGIDRYQNWRSLSNAVNDALGARRLFRDLGFEEVVPPLIDEAATNYAINSLVTDDLKNLDQRDSLVLFYAGHGGNEDHHLEDRTIKSGYLIPVDAKLSDRRTTWIELESWLRKVSRLPPRHILVILDACYSGIALDSAIDRYREELSSGAASMSSLNMRRSRRIITSALADEKALDTGPVPGNSLFTGYLIEGLEVGLAREGRTEATGSRIGEYVQRRVREYTRASQTPDFGPFELDRRGEMVIPLSTNPREVRRKSAQADAVPREILENLRRPEHWARAAAVAALAELLADSCSSLGRVTQEGLQMLAGGENSSVAEIAQAVLDGSMNSARKVHGDTIEVLEEHAVWLPGTAQVAVVPVEQGQLDLDDFLYRDTDKVIAPVATPVMVGDIDEADETSEIVRDQVEEECPGKSPILTEALGQPVANRMRAFLRWTGMLMLLFMLGGWIGSYLSRGARDDGETQRRFAKATPIDRGNGQAQTAHTATAVGSKTAAPGPRVSGMDAGEVAVTVMSEPLGAMARLVGTSQAGPTPVKFSGLIKGHSYQVEVEKVGYLVAELTVDPGVGDPPTVLLTPKPVVLRVASEPSGAQVLIGGRLHRAVTPVEIELSARVVKRKRVMVSVRKRGYTTSEHMVSLDKLTERSDAFVRNVSVVLKRRRETAGRERSRDSQASPPTPAISERLLEEVNPYSVANSKKPTEEPPVRTGAEGQGPRNTPGQAAGTGEWPGRR